MLRNIMKGVKPTSSLEHNDKKGAFVRGEANFRKWISASDSVFKPEKDRYHLYVAYACPWANRTLIMRNLKGLQDIIDVSIVHPTWEYTRPEDPEDKHVGWVFKKPTDKPVSNTNGYGHISCEGCVEDYVNGCKTIRDLYEMCVSADTGSVYSVPVLWDKKNKTIVNNESAEICEIFNNEFQELSNKPDVDLFAKELRKKIDEHNDWIYHDINNGVYKCGFAKSQEAYDESINNLFNALDKVEDILSKNKYILGDKLTIVDVRLFVTLIRFDEVYVVYFKTNKKRIADYPNIMRYTRDIYNMPEFKDTINMSHIKNHYYTSHAILNPYAIVPVGGDFLGTLENKQ